MDKELLSVVCYGILWRVCSIEQGHISAWIEVIVISVSVAEWCDDYSRAYGCDRAIWASVEVGTSCAGRYWGDVLSYELFGCRWHVVCYWRDSNFAWVVNLGWLVEFGDHGPVNVLYSTIWTRSIFAISATIVAITVAMAISVDAVIIIVFASNAVKIILIYASIRISAWAIERIVWSIWTNICFVVTRSVVGNDWRIAQPARRACFGWRAFIWFKITFNISQLCAVHIQINADFRGAWRRCEREACSWGRISQQAISTRWVVNKNVSDSIVPIKDGTFCLWIYLYLSDSTGEGYWISESIPE